MNKHKKTADPDMQDFISAHVPVDQECLCQDPFGNSSLKSCSIVLLI